MVWTQSHDIDWNLGYGIRGGMSDSVVPGSVQVPNIWTSGQNSLRTGPGTARKSESVLEPEPTKAVGQFQNLKML